MQLYPPNHDDGSVDECEDCHRLFDGGEHHRCPYCERLCRECNLPKEPGREEERLCLECAEFQAEIEAKRLRTVLNSRIANKGSVEASNSDSVQNRGLAVLTSPERKETQGNGNSGETEGVKITGWV